MDVLTALERRRSIKSYDPAFVMPEGDIKRLFDAVLLSPTSFNMQNWRFVAVTDKDVKQRLRAAAWDQAQVGEASLVVVLCADVKAWEKDPARYWRNAPQAAQDVLLPMMDNFYRGRDDVQRDEALRSCGIAAQSLMLAATAMGYATCPMIGFDPAQMAEIIHLPPDHLIGMIITVGKGLKDAPPRGGQLPYDEVVLRDGFPAGNPA